MAKLFLAILTLSSSNLAFAALHNYKCTSREIILETSKTPGRPCGVKPDALVNLSIGAEKGQFIGYSSFEESSFYKRTTFALKEVGNPSVVASLMVTEHFFAGRGEPPCGRGACPGPALPKMITGKFEIDGMSYVAHCEKI